MTIGTSKQKSRRSIRHHLSTSTHHHHSQLCTTKTTQYHHQSQKPPRGMINNTEHIYIFFFFCIRFFQISQWEKLLGILFQNCLFPHCWGYEFHYRRRLEFLNCGLVTNGCSCEFTLEWFGLMKQSVYFQLSQWEEFLGIFLQHFLFPHYWSNRLYDRAFLDWPSFRLVKSGSGCY
mmetsp:Transcript_3622/g.6241  ORF Transcript_3622/g.6241 Transcript_3622/m.6241 type:complete len:176 (+) Transcript_3622:406-933(+)